MEDAVLVVLVSTVAIAAPTHAQLEAARWDPLTTASHREVGDVQVSRSEVGGIDCFRGTATADGVSADNLLDVVMDIEGATRWSSAGVTEGRVLSRTGDRVQYYQYLDIPNWTMASDRFWFLEGRIERSGDTRAFRWTPLSGGGEHTAVHAEVLSAHPGAVEPTVNVGGWYFATSATGAAITYQICTVPGGSIPAYIQNAATKKTLPDTIGDVVREARRRQ